MKNTVLQNLGVATLSVAAMGLASGARATIVDISAVTATSANPAVLHLDVGRYIISWSGVADGGAYDGYNLNCPNQVCPGRGWRDDVFFVVGGDPDLHHLTLEVGPNAFAAPAFANAGLALAAYQGAADIKEWAIPSPYTGVNSIADFHSQPWTVNVSQATDVSFFIIDGTRNDNVGGVSLLFSSAVPEPRTWALMILGFGLAGTMLRRRTVAA